MIVMMMMMMMMMMIMMMMFEIEDDDDNDDVQNFKNLKMFKAYGNGSLFHGTCTLSPHFIPKMHQNVLQARYGLKFVKIIQNQCKLDQI